MMRLVLGIFGGVVFWWVWCLGCFISGVFCCWLGGGERVEWLFGFVEALQKRPSSTWYSTEFEIS